MLIALIAFLGGILTVLSPCILPVLPVLFARRHGSFRAHAGPLLAAMAIAFAAVASLVAFGAAWAVAANEWARFAAMALLALFGLALLLPRLAARIAFPMIALGAGETSEGSASRWSPVALGVATGVLWVPCAGPILGTVIAGAALNGPNAGTSFLLLAYAAGAGTGLAAAWWSGRAAAGALRRFLPAAEGLRRLAGAAVLAGVAAPALGIDASLLARIPAPGTTAIEQALVDRVQFPGDVVAAGPLSALSGATGWMNSPPLSDDALRGKVVLVNFWTYSCINCLRTLPYLRAWADKYRDAGLVVVGVHTPEFAFEKSPQNVRRALADLGITYPVGTDNHYTVWRAFRNRSWPAFHFFDAQGRLRRVVAGEHDYPGSERLIRELLAEAGQVPAAGEPARPEGPRTQAQPNQPTLLSGETYVGYGRATAFAGGTRVQKDRDATYAPAEPLRSGRWTLAGQWRIESERAVLVRAEGRLLHRFQARDLHMVLGPAPDGRPVRFRVRIDGQAPGADHGTDTDAQGSGVVDRQKLYQLVRQQSPGRERLFQIEFLDEGAEAYAFTFG